MKGLKRLKVKAIDESEQRFYSTYKTLKSVLLNCTDLEANSNKFYKMELREIPSGYTIWSHYARVPASERDLPTIGQKCNRLYLSSDLGQESRQYAELEYESLLKEKQKKGYVEIVLGTDQDMVSTPKVTKASNTTSLSKEVIEFVQLAHSEASTSIQETITTPLGQISLSQIERGAEILDTLKRVIPNNDKPLVEKYTNQYYSVIPHAFPRRIRRDELLLNTFGKLDAENDLIQVMRDVYNVREEQGTLQKQYSSLRTTVTFSSDVTLEGLERMIQDSVSRRHNISKLKVVGAFDVDLQVDRNFDPNNVGGNELLFHGTRNRNLVGILSSGFKINPIGVTITGKAFGDGIYLASHSTKSLQYCGAGGYWTSKENKSPISHLLIVDVALGKRYEVYNSKYFKEPPLGYHSVWAKPGQSLLHDEFIVYDVKQLKIRHIVQVDVVWR